jgi:parallel beta-helix repeat protein
MRICKIYTILSLILCFLLLLPSFQPSILSIFLEEKGQLKFKQLPKTNKELEKVSASTDEQFKYIIITPTSFLKSFQILLKHKSQYVKSTIITVEEIVKNESFWVNGQYGDGTSSINGNPFIQPGEQVTTNYSRFNNTAAKIRNFIRFAYTNWKTQFVLLGGDTEFIPSRHFFGYIPNWSAGKIVKPIQASIISDHYYAALNGTWNNDFDDHFGEEATFSVEDEADFSAEVCIGRAPVNDAHEADIFVDKVISFETSDKPKNVQFHQSYTNPQHIPDTTKVTEMCKNWIPSDYKLFTLYEKDGIVEVDDWKDSFSNPDKLLLFHVGNGYNDGLYSWYQLSWNKQKRIKFNVLDAGSLSNSFYPIHISISCLTSDFSENECLAEELLLTRNGGPSACIGNSEVGCISRDDAGAYSGEFFEQIFKNIFNDSEQHLGKNVQLAKEYFSNIAKSDRKYRWCFYEINLLGDPETPIFSKRKVNENNSCTVIVNQDFNKETPGWNSTHFNNIQLAINHINPYGTIIVKPGVYKEHLFINKTITLKGSNKSTVILTNKHHDNSLLLQLSCHSTTIQNFSILWNESTQKNPPYALIQILPKYNGNTIKNMIIQGKSDFGILVSNSIRNTIKGNWIIENQKGIGLINNLGGLFPSQVIVTCDNIISNNQIENQEQCGIIIEGSIHNYIFNNTFIMDSKDENLEEQLFFNPYLQLVNTKLNEIYGNYWNEPRVKPYPIHTLKGPITIFSLDLSRGLVFKLFKCILILNLGYPATVFDTTPSQHPISFL